ncbi:MAG: 50S ribosome-binding GTPase [Bacilli bacterium]|nr:50S ribosome-binding GTPase [Bacilli bacterium]
MNKKCPGCGSVIQNENINEVGYVKELNSDICERCFRINNYNDYKKVQKSNSDFINILKDINKTNDLVLLVVPLFDLPKNFHLITKELNNDILLVLTKRDLLPKVIKDEKLLNYMDNYNINYVDKIVISSKKNYQLDELLEKINQHKRSKNVYVVGYTNAGKSSLINKMIYNYTDLKNTITTSMLPSTTIDNIVVPINDDLTLIDTPGIIEDGSIVNHISLEKLKLILPKQEVKPITYQIKNKQSIIVDDLLRVDTQNTNLTFYFSNQLSINRYYKTNKLDDLVKRDLIVNYNSDLVISGFGFIKCVKKCKLTIYIDNNVEVFVRNSLI